MKLDGVILHLLSLPGVAPFENRWERYTEWKKLIVEVRCEGLRGFGECTAMHTPFYNYETIDTAWHVIERYFAPLVLGCDAARPELIVPCVAHIRGHHEARAALEAACWDLAARLAGVPLCQRLGGERRVVTSSATVGIEHQLERVVEQVAAAKAQGYARVRLKIKPGHDFAVLAAIRRDFPEFPLLADANGAYAEADAPRLRELTEFSLFAFEQPYAPRSLAATGRLRASTRLPICLDESITDCHDLSDALALSACGLLNLKVGRVGGFLPALQIYERCRAERLPVFVGAKYETEIGRLANIAIASAIGSEVPSDVAAGDRYFSESITEQPVVLCGPGQVEPLVGAGIGTELRDDIVRTRSLRKQEILYGQAN
jgi:O-succinylbenzoate synthase